MLEVFVTEAKFNPDISKERREVQPANIEDISSNDARFILDISKPVSLEQLLNMPDMSFTKEKSSIDKSIVAKLEQLKNIPCIFVVLDVFKPVKFISAALAPQNISSIEVIDIDFFKLAGIVIIPN